MREFSNLANVVFTRTYKRPTSTGRLETFEQVVDRVIGGNVRNHNVSEKEIARLKYFLMERKAGPGGRGWWFSGTDAQAKLGGAGLTNCWSLSSDNWENFVIGQDLLMLGGGLGMTVESKYVDKLPKVKKDVTITHKLTKDADYIVPDSREGWCKLLYRVLEAWFITGKSFTFSTICIRSAGEPIKGFGGISSGPRPLVRAVEKICALFITRQGKQLRPIDCADLLCCIGELVVSGNVRRSALLLMGDASDKEFLKAKRWDLGPIPTQRAMANFSVNASDAEHDLRPLFWKTYEQGEPFGIVNIPNIRKFGRMGEEKKDTATCVNPCQPDWATLLTPNGISTFEKVNVGDIIWSGKRWTKVVRKEYTGVKPVFSYRTHGGTFVGTENHRVVSNGVKVEVSKAKTIDGCQLPDLPDTGHIESFEIVDVISCGEYPVYSITVDDEDHTYWTGGLLVGNCGEATLEAQSGEPCNLQDINLAALNDVDEFVEAAALMHRWGKRVTCEKYHWPNSDEVIKRNRRIGTSISGCLMRPDLFNPEVLDRAYGALQNENVKYSKELGIEQSIRVSTIKPSGTISKAFDCACEGIHPAYSRFFIQRIRISSNDALIPKLIEAGHHIEPQKRLDGTLDPDTMVVDFYVKTPDGVPTSDGGFDTWKQLEAVQMAQKHWSDQSISTTVYYKGGDIPKIQEWLKNNLDSIKTVSFLKHSGHGFVQAPKETITEEQYEKLSAKVKPVQLDEVSEGDLVEGSECAGGSCPIR